MKSRRRVNSTVRCSELVVPGEMSKLTQIVNVLGTLFLIGTVGFAQQKLGKETPNVSIDYGGIFDEYDSSRSIKSRNESLEGFAEYLRFSPGIQGYLISYGSRVSYVGEAKDRAAQLKRYLSKIGVEPTRVEIIDGGHCEEWKIQLWFYVREAGTPTVFPCLDPKQVRKIRKRAPGVKRQRVFRHASNKALQLTAR
jgi:hypothetical protein